MFGRMTATPLIRLDAGKSLDVAVSELLAATDNHKSRAGSNFPRRRSCFFWFRMTRSPGPFTSTTAATEFGTGWTLKTKSTPVTTLPTWRSCSSGAAFCGSSKTPLAARARVVSLF